MHRPKLNPRNDQHDHNQSDRHGRGVTAAVLLKGLPVHVEQDHRRGVIGPSLRQQIDLIENLELRYQLEKQD